MQRNVTKATFILSNKIAKYNKPFEDAEFIKECMMEAVSVIFPTAIHDIKSILLSRRTVVRRIGALSANIHEQLLNRIKNFKWFSIALDESTDLQDKAQLLIFIKGIDDEFRIWKNYFQWNR